MTASRFAVDETLKGDFLAEREVWTSPGFAGCGVRFEVGKKYLVYVHRKGEKERDETNFCSGNRPLDEALAELNELRLMQRSASQSRVFGFITFDLMQFRAGTLAWPDQAVGSPASGVRVRLQSESGSFEALSEATGLFAIPKIPGGRYRITAEAPGFRFEGLPTAVDVQPPACSLQAILAKPL